MNHENKFDDFNLFIEFLNKKAPGFLAHFYFSYTLASNALVLKNENLRSDLLVLNQNWGIGLDENLIQHSKKENISKKQELSWSSKNFKETVELNLSAFKAFNYDWNGVVKIEG